MKAIRALALFALRALVRRGGASAAAVLAVAVVAAALASVVSLSSALRAASLRVIARGPAVTVVRLTAGRPGVISVRDADALRVIDGVGSVRARVWGYATIAGGIVAVVGVPRGGARGWSIPGEGLAARLRVRAGDVLALGAMEFAVERVARGGAAGVGGLEIDERDARAVLALADDEATDLAVTVTNADEASVVARRASELLPGTRVIEARPIARAYELTYGARGGLLALALVPAVLALAMMAWRRAGGGSDDEQREVGALRALGWSASEVLATRMMASAMVAIAGAAAGLGAAHAYVFAMGAPGVFAAVAGWSAMSAAIELEPAGDGAAVVSVFALVVAPYLAASAVPAWRAATVDPAEALR